MWSVPAFNLKQGKRGVHTFTRTTPGQTDKPTIPLTLPPNSLRYSSPNVLPFFANNAAETSASATARSIGALNFVFFAPVAGAVPQGSFPRHGQTLENSNRSEVCHRGVTLQGGLRHLRPARKFCSPARL